MGLEKDDVHTRTVDENPPGMKYAPIFKHAILTDQAGRENTG